MVRADRDATLEMDEDVEGGTDYSGILAGLPLCFDTPSLKDWRY